MCSDKSEPCFVSAGTTPERTFRKRMESPFLGNEPWACGLGPKWFPGRRSRLPAWVTSGEKSGLHFVPLRQRQCIVMTGRINLVPGDAVRGWRHSGGGARRPI